MIFGMLDPTVFGWDRNHVMLGGAPMPGMHD